MAKTERSAKELFKSSRAYVDYYTGRYARNLLSARTPVDPRKILVMTFQQTLTCNPRAIVDELLRRGDDVDVVVVGNGTPVAAYEGCERVRWVRRRTYEHFYEQASARVWIDNGNDCSWFPMQKKASQLYLQTWHGSLGLKRIDADGQTGRWLRNMRYAAPRTDFLLSNSDFEDWVFRTTYWPQTPILRTGHARNDLLFDGGALAQARSAACEALGIDAGEHIALYAPTFRDHAVLTLGRQDFGAIHQALVARFGGTWRIVVRAHYRGTADVEALVSAYPFVVNGTDYPDIKDLMAAAEVGITDYSSWICDYALTGRPGFLLVPDLTDYEAFDRGFYYPLEATPFAVARDADALADAIAAFDEAVYAKALDAYLTRLGCSEDGHAAEHAADLIEQVLGTTDPIHLSQNPLITELLSTY